MQTKKRLIRWAIGIALFLLIPLALTIRDGAVEGVGWNWTFFDFVFMGTLLFGAAAAYELVAMRMHNIRYRTAVALAVLTGVFLVWVNAAVGIIGDGDLDSPNAFYLLVLLIGAILAALSRFNPRGMAKTMFAVAIGQALVPVITFFFWPPPVISWAPGVVQVFCLNAVFVLMWIASAMLFWDAAAEEK